MFELVIDIYGRFVWEFYFGVNITYPDGDQENNISYKSWGC